MKLEEVKRFVKEREDESRLQDFLNLQFNNVKKESSVKKICEDLGIEVIGDGR
jgi:hypothetical protein